jgi:hypothetical protein
MYRIVNPGKLQSPVIPFGKYYVAGNYVDGSPEVTTNNELGVHMGEGTAEDKKTSLQARPFTIMDIRMQSAVDAYQDVLKNAGASLPVRDTLDARIINDVKNRSGRIIDVQGGFPHGTDYTKSKTAWPVLKSMPAPSDNDGDGMPDDWERKQGLNPNDKNDSAGNKLHKHYTNIEIYLNSIINARL